MGKLQTGRFERLGARTYSIKGPGALIDLDETVLGVLQLERQAGMEAHLIQEWQTFGRRIYQAAAVGAYSWIMLSNPPGSGKLMVVDGWQMANPVLNLAGFITRGAPPPFAATFNGDGLDTRIAVATEPAGRLFSMTSNIASFGAQITEAISPEWQDYPVVLAPDGSICFRGDAHNSFITLSFRWAERDAEPFELQ